MADYKLSHTGEEIDELLTKAKNAVLHTPQELTEEQKAQARENIGAEYNDLPRVFLSGALPSTKGDGEYVLRLNYISKNKTFECYATAKVQGSSSTTFKKKNYTLKLYEDESLTKKKKTSFRNWPSENKFVLKANTIDRTHARNVVSCRIWGDMVKNRDGYMDLPVELRNSPNMGAIDGFPIQLYLNGNYQGLYTWNIPKDDWMAGLNKDLVDHHAIICGEGGTNNTTGQIGEEYVSFNKEYTDNSLVINGWDWEDELGTVGDKIRSNWTSFVNLVVSGTDEEFVANLATYVNIESLIDTYIFKWFSCDVDGLGKNQFFYTYNAGLPWYSGVYDLDSTWGMYPSGQSIGVPNIKMQDEYLYPREFGYYNRLYSRLWNLFHFEICARWNAVKHTVLGLHNVINHFEEFHDCIPVELFAEDSAETTAGGYFLTTDDNTSRGFDTLVGIDKNNLQQIRNFAAARWAYVDKQINADDNLADPTSEDWRKGYYIVDSLADAADGVSEVTDANLLHNTVTNYIRFKAGDVFEITGCQAIYGTLGYGRTAFYDTDKNAMGIGNNYQMENDGEISVSGAKTTYNIVQSRLDGYAKGITEGYVRFNLTKFDSDTDINTDDIVIKRNPNGENAEAWT